MSDIDTFISSILPPEFLGVPTSAFIGLVLGVLIACYFGINLKFSKYKLDIGDKELKFDNRYIASAVVALLVVFVTVYLVMGGNEANSVKSFGSAAVLGFTEGMITIQAFNRQLDVVIKKIGMKMGLTEEEANKVADSVNVVDISGSDTAVTAKTETAAAKDEPKSDAKSAEVEDITLKSL